jgi:bloom syndrome protein
MVAVVLIRGEDVRIVYAHLGEIRSVLPSSVNVLALTATANLDTF